MRIFYQSYRGLSGVTIFAGLTLTMMSSHLSAKSVTDDRKVLYIDDQIRFADGLVARKHYDLAIDEYRRLIAKFADDPLAAEVWVQLAEAYAAKGDYDDAFATFKTFFSKFPLSRILPAARLKYALVLYKSGVPTNRENAFSILKSLKNSDVPAVIKDAAGFHLGKLYLSEKNEDSAIAEFSSVASEKIEESPKDDFKVSSLIELVLIYKKRGELEKARELLSRVVSNSNLSKELSLKLHWMLGELYYDAKQYQKAADFFAEFAVMFPDSPILKDALYKRLQSLYMLKDYTKVVSEVDNLISTEKVEGDEWERFYLIKSSALSKLNFEEKALEPLKLVMKRSKDPAMLQFAAYKYIEVLIKQGKLSNALNAVENYINQSDFSRNSVKDMVLLVADLCGADSAENIIRKALGTMDEHSENAVLLKLKLAAVLMRAGKPQDAYTIYTQLGESKTGSQYLPYAFMGEAQALEKQGKINEATAKYQDLIKKFPKSELFPEAMLRIAVMYLSDKKQWETSNIYLDEVIKRFPQKPVSILATFYKGYLAFYQGNYSEAKDLLTKLRNHKGVTPDLRGDIYIYLLWSLLRLNEDEAAIVLFNSLKDPERLLGKAQTAFLNELGTALLDKNPSASQLCFDELLRRGDKKARQLGYIGKAEVELKKGDPVKSIELLREAVKLDSDPKATNMAMMKLGDLLIKRGKEQEAVLVFEQSLENPYSKNSAAKARLGLAKILSKQSDRLKTANRYAMSVFILSQDKKICSEAMLLSIELSMRLNDRAAAEATWNEFKHRFPDLMDLPRAKKIAVELDK